MRQTQRPTADPAVEVTHCPYYLLTRASLTITAALRRGLEQAGAATIRPAYLGVLMCLWREDGQKVGDLGRCAGLEPSTMTGLLDRMERDDLVQRSPDPDDRRAQRVFLTGAGQRAQGGASRVVGAVLQQALAGVSEGDVQRLRRTLRRILANARGMNP